MHSSSTTSQRRGICRVFPSAGIYTSISAAGRAWSELLLPLWGAAHEPTPAWFALSFAGLRKSLSWATPCRTAPTSSSTSRRVRSCCTFDVKLHGLCPTLPPGRWAVRLTFHHRATSSMSCSQQTLPQSHCHRLGTPSPRRCWCTALTLSPCSCAAPPSSASRRAATWERSAQASQTRRARVPRPRRCGSSTRASSSSCWWRTLEAADGECESGLVEPGSSIAVAYLRSLRHTGHASHAETS